MAANNSFCISIITQYSTTTDVESQEKHLLWVLDDFDSPFVFFTASQITWQTCLQNYEGNRHYSLIPSLSFWPWCLLWEPHCMHTVIAYSIRCFLMLLCYLLGAMKNDSLQLHSLYALDEIINLISKTGMTSSRHQVDAGAAGWRITPILARALLFLVVFFFFFFGFRLSVIVTPYID